MSNLPTEPATPSDGHTHPSLSKRDAAGAWFTKAGKVTVVTILVAAVVVALFLIASAFLPRQWALVIGRQVDGNIGQGTLWGLFYGFLFTLLPVLVIGQARRAMFSTWRHKAIVVLVGLLLAMPNWLTLWIVLGNTAAAHAGERILDVDGPGFRWATLFGVILGIAVGLLIVFSGAWVRGRKKSLAEREAALAAREKALGPAAPKPKDPPTTTPTA